MSRIWISWEKHRRSQELAAHFRADLLELDSRVGGFLRHVLLTFRTGYFLARHRPRILFCQNPSIVLAAVGTLYGRLFNNRVVVDRHSNFIPDALPWKLVKWKFFNVLSNYSLKNADLTIVTNEPLAEIVRKKGGTPLVLQDKLPQMVPSSPSRPDKRQTIVVISTFDTDEPIDAVLQAAKLLGQEFSFLLTGNPERCHSSRSVGVPDNVRFTGYLPEQQYIDTLASADAIMVLTTQEHTLNCGAYEAVSLGKPLILSDTTTLRSYFSAGAVYVGPEEGSISQGIQDLFASLDRYALQVVRLSSTLRTEWGHRAKTLERVLLSWEDVELHDG